MKTKYIITSIVFCALVASYITITAYAMGSEDVFNPAGILYFPSIVIQLVANEGNRIICVDACGPCSAWGSWYVLVEDTCKIPDNESDCHYISPPMNWKFTEGKCVPVDEEGNLFQDKRCKEGEVELMPNACFVLTDVVFGDSAKRAEQGWRVYPGGVGWVPPNNSSLTLIHKEPTVGLPPLDLKAMLNDKIFVDKCQFNGGTWNEQFSDCEGIWEKCVVLGGIRITVDVTPECTTDTCLDMILHRNSCVFPYEN